MRRFGGLSGRSCLIPGFLIIEKLSVVKGKWDYGSEGDSSMRTQPTIAGFEDGSRET